MRTPVGPASGQEQAELEAVLASERFMRSPRLAKLLRYVCLKSFEGQADEIKEYNLATEVLGRPPGFDPSQDAIVRVEAHRLRKKLKEYYADEGAGHEIRITLSPGTYVPRIVRRPPVLPSDAGRGPNASTESASAASLPQPESARAELLPVAAPIDGTSSPAHQSRFRRPWIYPFLAACVALAVLSIWKLSTRGASAASVAPRLLTAPAETAGGAGSSTVRLLAGSTAAATHRDALGREWRCDRFFVGGRPAVCPHDFIARTNDPMLFQNIRTGEFSYAIPLQPGTYELHLFMVETTYGPGMITGGGENSRTFLIKLNGQLLLHDFDLVADANGPGIADERVFRDVQPGPDGNLNLEFISQRGQPILSALEVLPGTPRRQLPIRVVAQPVSITDRGGNLFSPDTFYSGGQLAIHKDPVTATPDPDLYAGERYGNFSYAIPADTRDTYTATLHFAETYWGGPKAPAGTGPGSRVFHVECNGVRLLENFDIYREAGGGMRALTKTFHHLKPNAQGKLLLSFEPVVNYASIYALEVEDEGR